MLKMNEQKCDKKKNIYVVLKDPFIRCLLISKRRKVTLQWWNLATLTKWSKLASLWWDTSVMFLLVGCTEMGTNVTSIIFLPKKCYLNVIMRKHQASKIEQHSTKQLASTIQKVKTKTEAKIKTTKKTLDWCQVKD